VKPRRDRNREPHEPQPLLAAACQTPITPPLEVGLLMSAVEGRWEPFEGVRLPLLANVLVLEQQGRRMALVSLDLLGLAGRAVGSQERFRRRIVIAAGRCIDNADLVIAATHTHSAPETLTATDLYKTPAFRRWVDDLATRIGQAIREAIPTLAPAVIRTASVKAPGLGIHRRIKTIRGIELSHPPIPRKDILCDCGPVDDQVHVLAVARVSDKRTIAVLVNATCHPVHEMCIRNISPDYPGEMARTLRRKHPGTVVLFFNGAAGDINPPTVSGGPRRAAAHGRKLAQAVEEALKRARPVRPEPLALRRSRVALTGRSTVNGQPVSRAVVAPLAGLRFGQTAWLFLPGEPFVEIGLQIKRASPFKETAVIGYAEDMIGYLPTERAFDEGGYELGPGPRARVWRGTEQRLVHGATELLQQLIED
jgi:neutral ceramidase